MTIAQQFAAKASVAFVAAAMIVSLMAPAAQAQSADELQAMINTLMAQITALQGQVGQGSNSVASGVCPYTWTRDLSQGSTGADVMKLQQFLNADADTRVAVDGAGSVGMETQYFGPATAAAVSKMQVKYRAEVLSPAGLVNPTGFFGPSSRAKANSVCVATPMVDDMDDMDDEDMDDEDMDDEDMEDVELGGEASLETFEISAAEDDEIEEGSEDAPIAELEVEFTDGDAEISRMDMQVIGSGEETDPWDVFESFSLWIDGDKVAEINADDEDDYLDEDAGTIRFSNLGIIAMEDEALDIIVAATVQSQVDGATTDAGWTVEFNALRFFDADGVAETETNGTFGSDFGVTESFTIEEQGFEDELVVRTSSNDPDGVTLPLDEDSKSDWLTVFIFDIDTDDSLNDIEINSLPVTIELSSSTYNALVDDIEIIIDGVTIDASASDVAGGGNATVVVTFDVDGDVVIDAGDEVEAEVRVRFKNLAPGNEGMTVRGLVTPTNANNIDAEGADDLTNTGTDQLLGSATGDYHTLRTTGLSFGDFSFTTSVPSQQTADSTFGEFKLTIEVTAIGDEEIYVPLTASAFDGAAALVAGAGAVYRVELADGTDVASSTADALSASLVRVSGGDEDNGYVRLDSGDSATFNLVVTFNPGSTAAQYRVVLDGMGFSLSEVPATDFEEATPASSYDTDPTFITS